MSHFRNNKGYWEEYESYRDERGRPRKRFLRYWGRRAPDGSPERLAQMLETAERKAEEIAQWQRETFGESAQERREREEKELEHRFDQAQFLLDTSQPQQVDAEGKEEDVQEPAADNAEIDFGEGGHIGLEGEISE